VLSTRQEPPTGQAAARPLSALAIVSQGACPRRQEHLRRSRLQRMRYPRHEPQGLARPVGKLHEVTRHDALGHTRHAGIRVQVLAFIRRQQKQRIGKARIKFFRHVFHLRLSAPQIAQSLSDCASSLNCSCLILNRADSSKPPFASLTLSSCSHARPCSTAPTSPHTWNVANVIEPSEKANASGGCCYQKGDDHQGQHGELRYVGNNYFSLLTPRLSFVATLRSAHSTCSAKAVQFSAASSKSAFRDGSIICAARCRA
jgi:hypothetical protein